MNEIVNRFLLVGDKFMPEMHLKQPGFFLLIIHVVHLPETKKELKSLCRQEIQISTKYGSWQIKRFTKKNSIRQSVER